MNGNDVRLLGKMKKVHGEWGQGLTRALNPGYS